MNNKLLYGLIGLLIGAMGMWLIGCLGILGSTNGKISESMVNNTTLDAHFIEQMIPHHEDAITISQIALTKSNRPEVKQLAMGIIDEQNHEIEQMRIWYKEWFGRELPSGDQVMQHHGTGTKEKGTLHMGILGTSEDLRLLENAEDFDRAYIGHMIPHHQMAVMMASMLKDGTNRSEMKTLADSIITSQTSEIEQMRMWLTNWD